MAVATGRGCDDRVDQLPSLLRQHFAKALLLGVELLVKGGLGHARAGDDVVNRGYVVTARCEDRQRSLGQTRTPLQPAGFARVDCAARDGLLRGAAHHASRGPVLAR